MVGNVQIVQRSGMRVVAQGGGRVPVAKPSLSLEDLALANQLRGNAVTETVKGRPRGGRPRNGAVRSGGQALKLHVRPPRSNPSAESPASQRSSPAIPYGPMPFSVWSTAEALPDAGPDRSNMPLLLPGLQVSFKLPSGVPIGVGAS